jgi:hypothetical protein
MGEPEKQLRSHELWVRVTSWQYGEVWRASQDTVLSMSKLVEMCLEKSFKELVAEVKKEQVKHAREVFKD